METFLINITYCIATLLVGILFKIDIWNNYIIKNAAMGITIDNLLFRNVDEKLIEKANNVTAKFCFILSAFGIFNSLISLCIDIINFSALFALVAVVFSWPIRIVYIFLKT